MTLEKNNISTKGAGIICDIRYGLRFWSNVICSTENRGSQRNAHRLTGSEVGWQMESNDYISRLVSFTILLRFVSGTHDVSQYRTDKQ